MRDAVRSSFVVLASILACSCQLKWTQRGGRTPSGHDGPVAKNSSRDLAAREAAYRAKFRAPETSGPMAGLEAPDSYTEDAAKNALETARKHFAAWAAFRASWEPIAAKHRRALAAASKLTNYYEQIDALAEIGRALRADAAPLIVKRHDPGPNWSFAVKSGVAFEIEARAAELSRSREIPTSHRVVVENHWDVYPAFSSEEVEHDWYLYVAGGASLVELLPEDRRHAVFAFERQTAIQEAFPAYASGRPRLSGRAFETASEGWSQNVGSEVWVEGKVDAVTASGGARVVKMHKSITALKYSDCHTTDRVRQIDGDGTVHYHDACKRDASGIDVPITIRIAELPPGVKKGCWVKVLGVVTKATASGRSKKTGAIGRLIVDLDGVYVGKLADENNEDVREY